MGILYKNAKPLIKEADVLLFKAGKLFKNPVGWTIGAYTRSPYSHTGLAHWENGELYCLEFREFEGSRMYPMDKYIQEGANIDIFRSVKSFVIPKMENDQLTYEGYVFSAKVADDIINTAKELLGEDYSYWTIWQMFKTYVPLVRLRTKVVKNGESNPKKFVCSTLVTYAYRVNFIDPIPFLCDNQTSPGDLARSGLFSYLFSID